MRIYASVYNIGGTFREVLVSTLPIAGVMLFLQIILAKPPISEILITIGSIVAVLIGFTIFLVGVEIGINPVGEAIGSEISKRRSRFFMVAVVFTISFLVTVAEPDVGVFANQVTSVFAGINKNEMVYAIAIGVAAFLIIAACRIVFKLSLRLILTASYAVVLIMAMMTPESFWGFAFDSGGVTTGPMTVPVLLAIGIGICSVGLYRNELDGFGMIGLASVGPIIALLALGIMAGDSTTSLPPITPVTETGLLDHLLAELKTSTESVLIAIIPLTLFFVFFQRIFLRFTWNAVKRMLLGITITSIGVIIFLTAIYTGFIPVAEDIGKQLNNSPLGLIVLGLILGFLVAYAEPAVAILAGRVESSSGGNVPKKTTILIISLGVGIFVAIGMFKVCFDINLLYIIVPGYIIALVLMWLGDKDMVGISFDAGGVSTGPMSVAIISTMYTGIASVKYSGLEAVTNGFGVIALIALAPIVFLGAFSVYIKIMKRGGNAF